MNPRLKLIAPIALRSVMGTLVAEFARAHDHVVDATFDLNPAIPKRLLAGDDFAVGITNPWYVSDMIAAGAVVCESHQPFGRVPLAIGARNTGKTAIDQDIPALLTRAASIAYTAEGTSGGIFLSIAGHLGIRDALSPALRPMAAGEPVAGLVAGQVELAIAPLTVIAATKGIQPIAIFPPSLGGDIEMSVFICAGNQDNQPATDFIQFLSDAGRDALLSANGIFRFELPLAT